MKRRRRSSQEGGGNGNGKGKGNEGGNNSSNNNRGSNNKKGTMKKKKKKNPLLHPQPPVLGTVATRTRRQTNAIASTWNHPRPLIIKILSYADPETIRTLCCVSKQLYDIIAYDPGMEYNRAIPLLEISPRAKEEDKGRMGRLFDFLHHHRDKVQLYREIKIIDANKFVSSVSHSEWMEWKKIIYTFRLYGIVSLDMSSAPPSTDIRDNNELNYTYLYFLPKIFPNLEKITWHNIDRKQSAIEIDGWDMMHATNLKHIYMDGSVFYVGDDGRDKFSDLENDEHSDIFPFHKLSSKLLERVSIRNAKWVCCASDDLTAIPQNALIKFIRNAPTSLRWFRSDLTEDNMNMLRSERPGIELVN